jgi:hypothetical protein
MPAAIQGQTQGWFTINEFLSKDVSANTDIDVDRITAVSFSEDVNIKIGSLATLFSLPAGVSMGIDSSTSVIQVDAAAFMFAMGGK